LFPFGNTAETTTCDNKSQIVIANQEPNPFPPLAEDASGSAQESLTVNEAAQLLGVDSFTVLSLIQRGKVIPSRSPSGEITLARSELAKLTGNGA
jgi:hypothetical protein